MALMAVLRLFASAREAAGASRIQIDGGTVEEVLAAAHIRFGEDFAAVVSVSKIWVNGDQVSRDHPVGDGDEVAVLPPVSGG